MISWMDSETGHKQYCVTLSHIIDFYRYTWHFNLFLGRGGSGCKEHIRAEFISVLNGVHQSKNLSHLRHCIFRLQKWNYVPISILSKCFLVIYNAICHQKEERNSLPLVSPSSCFLCIGSYNYYWTAPNSNFSKDSLPMAYN